MSITRECDLCGHKILSGAVFRTVQATAYEQRDIMKLEREDFPSRHWDMCFKCFEGLISWAQTRVAISAAEKDVGL